MDDFSQPGLSNYYGYAPSPANFIKPCKDATCSTLLLPSFGILILLGIDIHEKKVFFCAGTY